jgi:hypothetical protein
MSRQISLLVIILVSLFSLAHTQGQNLPPSKDPWYTAPADYESAIPGTILRVRAAPGNLTSSIPRLAAAYNILYRTTDSRYLPAWAVTTLLIPQAPQNNSHGANALLSYQIPYDSANVDYSPSYLLQSYLAARAAPILEIYQALSAGWYVNVPDYEGPLASYTAGVLSGHSTLDSVRAVLHAGYGLSSNTSEVKYAMWGYSGGALASEWAAELQVQYAPELNFAGAALGGLTPDVLNVINACNAQPCANQLPQGILGLISQFPDAEAYVRSQLRPSGPTNSSGFLAVRNISTALEQVRFTNVNISSYFISGSIANLTANPILQRVVNSNGRMGYHGVPTIPLFVYKSINDELSPVIDTDRLVDKYCAVGASIQYERNTIGNHAQGFLNGNPDAFKFLTGVLSPNASVIPYNTCNTRNTSFNVSAAALSGGLAKRTGPAMPVQLPGYLL